MHGIWKMLTRAKIISFLRILSKEMQQINSISLQMFCRTMMIMKRMSLKYSRQNRWSKVIWITHRGIMMNWKSQIYSGKNKTKMILSRSFISNRHQIQNNLHSAMMKTVLQRKIVKLGESKSKLLHRPVKACCLMKLRNRKIWNSSFKKRIKSQCRMLTSH